MDFALSETDLAWRDHVRTWVDRTWPKARARELEASDQTFPQELWDDLSAAGFHGVGIPEQYGGQGGNILTQAIMARELTRNLGGLIATWLAPAVGGTLTLLGSATEEQKQHYLPRMASGEVAFAIAVTEPGGGTDVLGAMRSTTKRDGDQWVLNGQKMWSTGAGSADFLLVLAAAEDGVGTNLLVVPTDAVGLEMRHTPKLGVRSLASYEVFMDDVHVPAENLIGEPGRGWHAFVKGINADKTLLASCSTGIIDGVLEDALTYLSQREAFGRTIEHFQILQHYVADIACWQHTSELVSLHAAWLMASGEPASKEATMAKYIASNHAVRAADLGIQMLGGMGYAAETDMQRYWRDARLWCIAPITNEMSRNFIAGKLGMPRSF